jgi:carbamoyl-phosphate synthase small subunit
MDLAMDVKLPPDLSLGSGRAGRSAAALPSRNPKFKVVAIDYGAKRNILRCLTAAGCDVTVVPATATTDDVLRHQPDGVFLANGPGDPAATGEYAVPVIKALLKRNIPIFGICLGHQMLALALGGKTEKMPRGHRGANHPVKDLTTGKVEITSQNHGFCVVRESLAQGRESDARELVRRLRRRPGARRQAGVLRAVPPGSLAGPDGLPLPLPPLRREDGGAEVTALKMSTGSQTNAQAH